MLICWFLLFAYFADELDSQLLLLSSEKLQQRIAAQYWFVENLSSERAVRISQVLPDLLPEARYRLLNVFAANPELFPLLASWLHETAAVASFAEQALQEMYVQYLPNDLSQESAELQAEGFMRELPFLRDVWWDFSAQDFFSFADLVNHVNCFGGARKSIWLDPKYAQIWNSWELGKLSPGPSNELFTQLLQEPKENGENKVFVREFPHFLWISLQAVQMQEAQLFVAAIKSLQQKDEAEYAARNLGTLGFGPIEKYFCQRLKEDQAETNVILPGLGSTQGVSPHLYSAEIVEILFKKLLQDIPHKDVLAKILIEISTDSLVAEQMERLALADYAKFSEGSKKTIELVLAKTQKTSILPLLRERLLSAAENENVFALKVLFTMLPNPKAQSLLRDYWQEHIPPESVWQQLIPLSAKAAIDNPPLFKSLIPDASGMKRTLLLVSLLPVLNAQESSELVHRLLDLSTAALVRLEKPLFHQTFTQDLKIFFSTFDALYRASSDSEQRTKLAVLYSLWPLAPIPSWHAQAQEDLLAAMLNSAANWPSLIPRALGRFADVATRDRLCALAVEPTQPLTLRLQALSALEEYLLVKPGPQLSDERLSIEIRLGSLKREPGPLQKFVMERIVNFSQLPLYAPNDLQRNWMLLIR